MGHGGGTMSGRWRRSKRPMAQADAHAHIPPLLPLTTSRKGLSNAISCWYCDCKITSFNELIFQFGRRHARVLRTWFSIGIGFSLAALAVVVTVLFWELATAMHIFGNSNVIHGLPISYSSLFGLPPLVHIQYLSIFCSIIIKIRSHSSISRAIPASHYIFSSTLDFQL